MSCPFCTLVLTPAAKVVVIRDQYPVSRGHTLIIPRRHVRSIFELTGDEERAVWRAIVEARRDLREEFAPDGFNIGFNDGEAAGQTVMHAHVHLIPRYAGDVEDPRGGVRHCIPGKGYYTADKS